MAAYSISDVLLLLLFLFTVRLFVKGITAESIKGWARNDRG